MPRKLDWPTEVSLKELGKHKLPRSLESAIAASVRSGLDSYTSFMRALAGVGEDAVISTSKRASQDDPTYGASEQPKATVHRLR